MPIIANTEGGVAPPPSHRFASRRATSAMVPHHDLLDSVVERTRDWLLAQQAQEGYWVAELEGDTILESEYVLLMAFLGRESDRVCAG